MHQAGSDFRNRLLVARLPSMPQILLKLIDLCQNEEVGMSALADLVAKDPAMTSKILSVANSSAYHQRNRKAGLEHSLMALGTEMIKTLVISESIFQVFNSFSHSGSTDLRGFWKHSLSAALIAREIAAKMNYPHAEEAYLAGLLHDVGRLALLAAAPKEYGQHFLAQDDEELCAVEQATLSITHSEAGAWLIERWNLDSFLADSALFHHEPVARLEATHPLIRIVLLAHLLSSKGEDDAVVKTAGELCGLDQPDLAKINKKTDVQLKSYAEHLGIDLSGLDEVFHSTPGTFREQGGNSPLHERLVGEVLNYSLGSEASRFLGQNRGSIEAMIESATRSARLLFDLEDAAVLLMDSTELALVGYPVDGGMQRLKELSIPLAKGGCVSEAARQRRPALIERTNASPVININDTLLLRTLAAEALLCLPLLAGQRCLGVIVGKVFASQLAELRLRERFLISFGQQAGEILDKSLRENEERSRRNDQITEEYRAITRQVIHEANNPISIIKNYLSVLDTKLKQDEAVSSEISILNDEIDRVGRIINGLSEARRPEPEKGVEINRLVRDVIHLFENTEFVPSSVKIIAQPQSQAIHVAGNYDTHKQILINLVKNALEALPAGGELQLANRGLVSRDGALYSELCVKDNGPGIPPEIMDKLYAPGRSTKGGNHRGVGLSIVHKLVKQTGGFITCRSNSSGTSFELLLPVHDSTALAPATLKQ